MSRLSFILAVTLLVVAGSMVFMMTFDREDDATMAADNATPRGEVSSRISTRKSDNGRGRTISSRGRDSNISLPKSATSHLDRSDQRQVDRILARTRSEARHTLAKYSERYKLTNEQRRDIFPLIVAHHKQAHPAMMVNGQPLPSITPGSSLEESVAGFLDSSQQDALAEDVADDDAWWADVVGQLESDLDTAISNGEMVPVEEAADTPPSASEPAVGQAEEASHSGGNLFDLLGQ